MVVGVILISFNFIKIIICQKKKSVKNAACHWEKVMNANAKNAFATIVVVAARTALAGVTKKDRSIPKI